MTTDRQFRGAIVVAAPSLIGKWGIDLIREATAAADPLLDFRILDRLDIIDPAVSCRTVYATQFPGEAVLTTIRDGTLPVVAFVDDATDATAYQRRVTGCTFMEALRSIACGAVANPSLFRGVSTLVFYRGNATNPVNILERTIEHLAISLHKDKAAELTQKHCPAGDDSRSLEASLSACVPLYAPRGNWTNELTDEEASIAEQALGPIVAMANSGDWPPVTWPFSVFLSGDRPNERASIMTEMTGRARHIYYGPYLHLPPGHWEGELVVGFSQDAVGSAFTLEVCSNGGSTLIARARFRASRPGLFRGTFVFSLANVQDPIELRFSNDQGAIEGRFGLAWVKLYYRNEMSSS
jgi:hypothetical protein